ncbi:hypothetical protein SDC9_48274 [bioreactor metagenome]|uniref:Uncharacterized protein n=1 Tax=bioreactor metagenome TaxID=1076179 RepID=A0A644WEL1_9ZZZZ
MRTVDFSRYCQTSSGDPGLIQKRTGHLIARMEELGETGLSVTGGMDPVLGIGRVAIKLPKPDAVTAVGLLANQWHIRIDPPAADGTLLLSVTISVSFEDIDYFQAAVMNLIWP